ncbi:hypothetical protein E1B28_012680 [Marasmius oreades]|uniref:DUF202 domain-containing protein n=1 Tax=Marasmius oreades TaxID=181124 RepID=A0A9P7UQ66_9AGAR|nr:uncharacterized protein E1B28_012680 [Marasmius oreades]KAG7088711.1 hypothetical protein E1B28_012680 [Marasmius oreades]
MSLLRTQNPSSSSRKGSYSALSTHNYLSDSDDNSATPRGASPSHQDPELGTSSSPDSKRSLRFSIPSSPPRPGMSHLLDKQSPAPAQVQKKGDFVESPIEEEPQERHEQEHSDQDESESDRSANESRSDTRQTKSWRFRPSLVLENSGSVARDHLASERTFLAYVRTSLAIASTGVALVQLFTIASKAVSNHPTQLTFSPATKRVQVWARPLGVVTVGLGIAVLSIGVVRYFTVQNALVKGKFPVARFLLGGIAFVLGVLVLIVFGVLVSGAGPRG